MCFCVHHLECAPLTIEDQSDQEDEGASSVPATIVTKPQNLVLELGKDIELPCKLENKGTS